MEFQKVVDRRRMVRNFHPDVPVGPEVRERILANTQHGPSAGFSQGFEFLVCESAAERDRFWHAGFPPVEGEEADPLSLGLRRASLIVVSISHRDAYLDRYAERDKGWRDRDEARWPVPYWHIDTGFAALLTLLTVVDQGLGACFFGIPPERNPPVRDAFGVPKAMTPICAVAIGHRAPDELSPSLKRGRRRIETVVHRGKW